MALRARKNGSMMCNGLAADRQIGALREAHPASPGISRSLCVFSLLSFTFSACATKPRAAETTSEIISAAPATTTKPAHSPPDSSEGLPTIVRALFIARAAGSYVMEDEVDLHDPSGASDTVKEQVECVVLEPHEMEGRTRGVFECASDLIPFALRYSADAKGLFLDHDGAIPTLSFVDRMASVSFDAGDNEERIPCTRSVSQTGIELCVTTRCNPRVGYGPTLEKLCLDEQGIASFETEGVEGPRHRTLTRGVPKR
jgi:hypothetical protein